MLPATIPRHPSITQPQFTTKLKPPNTTPQKRQSTTLPPTLLPVTTLPLTLLPVTTLPLTLLPVTTLPLTLLPVTTPTLQPTTQHMQPHLTTLSHQSTINC
ncbi:Uncharacterized protein APZ42_000471 [Daphnia magna]|uniref:Uncharacterized protein n=1 Tax=Daphnia magna TaxID=35525 RepID=A0A164JM82_9CRUS|nr:Uncharacterized protein APZ42_000471 [Daphnia magna]